MIGFLRFFTFQRQLVLFALSLVLTVYLWATVGFAWAWIPLLVLIILLTKHFLIGTVNGAAMKLQMGDPDAAEKLLKYTFNPSWLQFGYHGMYYFLQSGIAMQKGELKKTEALAHKAMKLKVPDDIKGMLHIQLINVYGMYQKNNPNNKKYMMMMKEQLQKAKKLNISNPQVRENIKEIDLMLKGQHQQQKQMMKGGKKGMRGQMNQGFMKRGGRKKRR
jgi:hypothetical protein